MSPLRLIFVSGNPLKADSGANSGGTAGRHYLENCGSAHSTWVGTGEETHRYLEDPTHTSNVSKTSLTVKYYYVAVFLQFIDGTRSKKIHRGTPRNDQLGLPAADPAVRQKSSPWQAWLFTGQLWTLYNYQIDLISDSWSPEKPECLLAP